MKLDVNDIQVELDRRKPGTSRHVTQRKESDTVEILSGLYNGVTTGTPIGLLIRNEDQKAKTILKLQIFTDRLMPTGHTLKNTESAIQRGRTQFCPSDCSDGGRRCNRQEMAERPVQYQYSSMLDPIRKY